MSAERPQREVAHRLFAAEFEDAAFTYAESDEERAPNYVVTPTGARVNRMFVVGVLTEVEQVSDDVLRARIVDPTGAFVVYAGQYQPEAMAFFERTEPPAFVAVTGKARTFQPEDSDIVYTSIRPESANEVTAETRDRWVVQTAEQTLDRVETFAGARDLAERGDALTDALTRRGIRASLAAGIPKAMDHYGTTTGYLAEVRRIALDATKVVANQLDEVEGLALAPDEGETVELDFAYALPEPAYETGPDAEGGEETETAVESGTETDEQPDTTTESETEPEEAVVEDEAVETSGSVAEDDDEEVASEAEPAGTEEEEAADASSPDEPTEADVGEGDESAATEVPEPDAEATGDADLEAGADVDPDAGDDVDPDEMYELSEEERQEVEEEFGVGFETGNEVQEPGEADIDTPDPEPAAEVEADEEDVDEDDVAGDEATASEADEDETDTAADETDADAADLDLEDVVVETMADLDDGDGAPRDDLVETVSADHGVSADAVEEAIQDALMGGRCYESGDDRITPI